MGLDRRTFIVLMLAIFVLHILTYPSVHLIFDDYLHIDQAKDVCAGNFTRWTESETRSHGPLYPAILCATSVLHGFDIYGAQLVSFAFLLLAVTVWYVLLKDFGGIDLRKFALLFFANSLWWVYSFRTLMDATLGFFLSVGLLAGFLYFEKGGRRNFALAAFLLSCALLVKEIALIFAPVFLIYLLYRRSKDIKKYALVALPFLPYLAYLLLTGFRDITVFLVALKATTPNSYEYIPYGSFPTAVFLVGIFGLGIVSCLVAWKDLKKEKQKLFGHFLVFSLILVLLTELLYDFVISVNLPRYHIVLIPFLTLLISETSKKGKWMKYVYWFTLLYLVATGFFAAYYFHVNGLAIWKALGIW